MGRSIINNRWYRLLPVAFITYSLAYLDRANFGLAAAGGLRTSLHITGSMTSLLGAFFFLGYFIFQIPGTLYAERRGTRKLIFRSLILWGLLAAATGMTRNIRLLLLIRFALGAVESAVMPALLIFLTRWFTRAERSRANAVLILGNPVTILWMSILSGYLVHAVGWQWMFIAEGLPAVLWAFCWRRLVMDQPRQAAWLPAAEITALEKQLAAEQHDIRPVRDYATAFRSTTVMLLCAQYALWSIGVYGFVMWLPSILRAAPHMNMVTTGWLAAVPYVFAMLLMIGTSLFADKTGKREKFIWPFLLVASIALYASFASGAGHFWLSFALLTLAGATMYAPYGPFFAVVTELLPENVAGGALALINSMGALGSFGGTYLVGYLNGKTGGFGASYLLMSGSLFLSALFTVWAVRRPRFYKGAGNPGQAASSL